MKGFFKISLAPNAYFLMKKKPYKTITHFFKDLFSFLTIRISNGPLAGKKWIATSGSHFVKGDFEPYKTEAFLKIIEPEDVFFDIGAHFGYFSIIAADKGAKKVFAFEPRPSNTKFLKKHLVLNEVPNVTLVEAAVAASEGYGKFNTKTGSALGHLDKMGDLEVKVVNLDEMVRKELLPKPDLIKIDVEGGEMEVLNGIREIVRTCRPRLLVATHSQSLHDFVINFLEENNYTYRILNQDGKHGDTEIVATPN
jgi:FkbM family methyltransferase